MSVESPSLQVDEQQSTVKPKAVAKADKHIWGIFIALCIISTIELYSASSREVASSSIGVMGPIIRHLVMLGGGALIVETSLLGVHPSHTRLCRCQCGHDGLRDVFR